MRYDSCACVAFKSKVHRRIEEVKAKKTVMMLGGHLDEASDWHCGGFQGRCSHGAMF